MEQQTTDTAASSTANAAEQTFAIPSGPARAEWLKTGDMPAAPTSKEGEGTPKEASTPSKENASADDPAENAAASATALKQEKTKQQSPSAKRLNEILADLKEAGLSPEELKTYKREAKPAATNDAPAKAAPDKTLNPLGLEAPVKPKLLDKNPDGTDKYKTWEELDEAKDQYHDAMATYRAKLAVQEDRQQRAAEAQQRAFEVKVSEAKARYGDQTEATIGEATRALLADGGIPMAVQDLIGGSNRLMDVMYTLGSDAQELASFVQLAKSDPAAAIRKFVLLEHLVEQELAKGTGAGKGTEAQPRNDDGEFVSKTPAKPKPAAAPAPPDELNTRGSAPPDASDTAFNSNDFRSFRVAENRKDIARRKGA